MSAVEKNAPGAAPTLERGLYSPRYEHDSCGIGFVADIKGRASHQIVSDAAEALAQMEHRGACGAEPNTGDGAGILIGLPHEFFARVVRDELKQELPPRGRYAAGIVFLPTVEHERMHAKSILERCAADQGQRVLGWRYLPVDPGSADLGPSARNSQPWMEQVFIAAGHDCSDSEFERRLLVIRKQTTNFIRSDDKITQRYLCYICSLSARVIVYKGMLTPSQLVPFFPELGAHDFRSHVAVVHARFSTNTVPSWDRAQPCRFMCHNGEINTLRGNINYMTARQGVMQSSLFSSEDLKRLFPVIEPDCSDSGNFDNALELLMLNGRSAAESIMMMIPEAWRSHRFLPEPVRKFYEYHSCILEPWDGPASIIFTDGNVVGAVLDRNGLRPSRYYITHDDRIIMASEVGVLPVDPANIKEKGRLQPGRVLIIDFESRRIIPDEELKADIAGKRPYGEWLRENRLELGWFEPKKEPGRYNRDDRLERLRTFGYTTETFQFLLLPLVQERRDPVGSMGNDSRLACLSDKPRLLYDYFKQLFAQVTNPAIDSIREEIIMSLECYIGPEQSVLSSTEKHCRRMLVHHPILRNLRLAALKELDFQGWRTKTIDTSYPMPAINGNGLNPSGVLCDGSALSRTLDRICLEAEKAIDEGYSLIILSDRGVGSERIAPSALLSCAAVHHHLIRCEKRTRVGLVVETGEAREVHHFCLLTGYGADAVNPYLAYEALWQARHDGLLDDEFGSDEEVTEAYRKGVAKGMLKVMAKMGISTLQSYKGAQIFEALGLNSEVIDRCFAGTPSRIKGVGFDVLETESIRRHILGFGKEILDNDSPLPNPGEYHWRPDGEQRAWNPETIAAIQAAASGNSAEEYRRFSSYINDSSHRSSTLRGLLDFNYEAARGPIPIEEVEPAAEIVKRFCTGAMSFGSLSIESHEALAVAMNRLGGKSNTGEGGEDPIRFQPLPNGDSKSSAIKQVASGRFGVTSWYLTNAEELQIKIAQGAKPGEGGELPGKKVDYTIARIRYSTPGVGLISPPPHHDIYSIEDLKQLIFDLKNSNPAARISVKLVSEVGVGTIAAGVAKGKADAILISGDSGGTGASPLTSIKHAGLPWELGLAETHQALVFHGLRSRVSLQTDGGLKTGRDVAVAALLGAEEFGFSTAPIITLGCVMMRKCHLNTCPVGVATQDPELRRRFRGRPEYIVNYLFMVAEELREIMAGLGLRHLNEMVGRVDLLKAAAPAEHWKSDSLDLAPLLQPTSSHHSNTAMYRVENQDHQLDRAIDHQLISLAENSILSAETCRFEFPIHNINRAVGTMLSHKIVKRWGEQGLPEDTVHFKFRGSAGQSFGAFLCGGVTLELEGDANDYVGKGLSRGKLIIYPPRESTFKAEENIIVGNVALYGATDGLALIRGLAAERFCVRNSGVRAVVEGVGDHGCEYMTGGRVVILGPTGRNFAAGMSGGIAYVWDPHDELRDRCNPATVELEPLRDQEEVFEVYSLIDMHFKMTESPVAERLVRHWNTVIDSFVKVMPLDYKRVLMERRRHDEEVDARIHGVSTDG